MSTDVVADTRPPSEQVIEAIADYADVDPLDFDVPLAEVIDPEALDSLLESNSGDNARRVEFRYGSLFVTVTADHEGVSVDVTAPDKIEGDCPSRRQRV